MPTITVGVEEPTIQDAIDAMAAEGLVLDHENRGTIIVPPGHYDEQVSDYVNHLDIIAREPGTAIIQWAGTGSGGTYRIGVDSNDNVPQDPVWDKVVSGLRIIRNNAGAIPEGALYVGWPEGTAPAGNWDSIIIRDCIIEGVRDGVHISGFTPTPAQNDPWPEPGLLTIQSCIIRCLHDAVGLRGDFRFISKSNLIHVDTRSIDPYLTNNASGKATGFHLNRRWGENPLSFIKSSHDTIYMIGGNNVAGASSPEAHMAGYLFYDEKTPTGGNPLRTIPRTEIVAPKINLEWNHNGSPANPVAGVSVWSSRVLVPNHMLTIAGGSIRVRQTSTGQSAPLAVHGVHLDAAGASEDPLVNNYIRVVGTAIKVENAKSSSDVYCLTTVAEHDKIVADTYSDEPILDSFGGTIAAAGHKP